VHKYGGVGMGLSICKGLVNLMNGKIWCVSEVEKGSSFYFSIPYRPFNIQPYSDTPVKKKILDKDWSNYTVLIVEDDILNHKVIRAMLRNTEVNILHASNGKNAIAKVRSNPQIDLMLMNEHLPDMCGLETAGEILNINPDIPVIAQTANLKSDFKQKCIEAGCADYIGKPTNMGELFNKMSKFLPDPSFNLLSN
jgi:CheY-like chemotaxis protein